MHMGFTDNIANLCDMGSKVASADPRVDGVNETVNSVLPALHMIWQRNNAALRRSVLALAHFQLPLCKLPLSCNLCVQAHILMKLNHSDRPPQHGVLDAGTHSLAFEAPGITGRIC
jgi:hypothetical protein